MNIITNGKHCSAYSTRDRSTSEVIWSEPPPIEKLNWLIHLQFSRGQINTCQELIRNEITKSYGRNEYAYYTQGVIAQVDGRVQEALENYQICYKLNSRNVEYIKRIAKCLLSLEAALEAEKVAEKPDWEICHHLGESLLRLEDIPKAKDYARRAVQLGKQEASYTLLVKILSADDDFRSAVAVCNAALETCPDSVEMLTECGLLYLRIGQTQQAFERLSSALALEPTSARSLLGVGCITQSHEEFDVALSKYKIALQSAPDSVALWNNIGMCFHGKQKYVAAISCLKRALWLSPLNSRVLLNLGLVYLATQQAASAFNFLSAAVNIRPDFGQSFMLLACSLLELKDPENALLAAKRGFSISPDDPTVALNMGVCLIHNKVWSEAVDAILHFRTLAERNPYVSQDMLEYAMVLSNLLGNELGDPEQGTPGDADEFLQEDNYRKNAENGACGIDDKTNEPEPSRQLLDPDEV